MSKKAASSILLEAKDISKYYGDRKIFEIKQLTIHRGEAIGIVGLNGSGKTTLLKMLAGILPPDSGHIKSHVHISYISQLEDETENSPLRSDLKKFRGAGDKSGGERMRLRIAGALSEGTALLMADEPTSNLDLNSILLLEKELEQVETLVLISHDRALLDRFCGRILELREGEIHEYTGNYSDYLIESEARRKRAVDDYESYAGERKRLERALQGRREKASGMADAPGRMGNSEARLHRREIKERRAKVEQTGVAIRSRLEKMEVKEKPRELPRVYIDLRLTKAPPNDIVLRAQELSFAYGKKEILRSVSFELPKGAKYALIGPNGVGKSTLLHCIQNRETGIILPPKAKTGLLSQQFENIDLTKSALENVLTDSVQSRQTCQNTLARLLLQGEKAHRPASSLSGGERVKLGLAKLILGDVNVLLMDEPTNYLDLPSLEQLQEILVDYEGSLVMASHDRAFIGGVATGLFILKDGEIETFKGRLRDYENRESDAEKNLRDEITRLEMRQMQLLAILGAGNISDADKELAEAEFTRLSAELRTMRG